MLPDFGITPEGRGFESHQPPLTISLLTPPLTFRGFSSEMMLLTCAQRRENISG